MTKKELVEDAAKSALKWRLAQQPTREDVITLLEIGVITKEEARTMLFNEVSPNEEVKALKEQVKALEEQVNFCKTVIDKLGNSPPQLVYKYVHDYVPRIAYYSSAGTNTFGWDKTKTFLANSINTGSTSGTAITGSLGSSNITLT